ncbi:MAG: NAD-dependent epimerase/dehydratase family protein [Gammaproteobacteria bacterium]|nr:NAD-dependent epimerase/dehydratase family protein [Gammaproteobacteria bacterium]
MKALVTGGAGFIGSHIVDRLLNDGHEVIVLDDFSTGHRSNLADNNLLSIIEGDISNYETVKQCMTGVDWVFHKAAVASVPKTVNDPVGSSLINYQGTLHLLEAARENKVKRFVFASSAALYGDEPTLPKVETMCPVTLSPYAVDKLASESACGMYTKLYGLETVCLRYFNVYGPRQDPSSPYSGVISIFTDKLKNREIPMIYGDGEQTRDFVYVSDVVEANIKAVTEKNCAGQFFNIATGNRITLNNLLRTLCDIYKIEFNARYEGARKGDIKQSYASIDKATALLHWNPSVVLKNGLPKLV